jgi:hypothetical protein
MIGNQDEDVRLVHAASEELEPYLRSKVLYWRISGCNLPLTPGNLLLGMRKSQDLSNSPDTSCCSQIYDIIKSHQSGWMEKLKREAKARLSQWENTLQDYKDEGITYSGYSYQVRVRVILELLCQELQFPDISLENKLEKMDDELRRMIEPGDFIWDIALKNSFPADGFWLLYAKTKEGKS